MELVTLKEWWLDNTNVWFGSTESDDIEITNKFESLIDIKYDLSYLIDELDQGIGYIILYDQITRHITRAKKYPNDYFIGHLDNIIDFVNKFYQYNKSKLYGYDFCFVLLPLRHTGNFNSQLFVIQETWNKINLYETDTPNLYEQELIKIYRNYLKASYERISDGNVYLETNIINWDIHERIEEFINIFSDILDPSCHHYKSNSNYIKYDSTNIIMKNCSELKKHFPSNLILSISGGVDSMILSYVFVLLGINFVMVHINYSNRGDICKKEKEMLKYWAGYIGIELYIRDIEEINRAECMKWDMRNLYEDYTRDVRYQSYIDVANIKNWNSDYGVVLGHNHDDCIENILTNITNKTKYNNLYGMEFKSNINFKSTNINFIRPMLKIAKNDIYNLAHNINIPYLFDSTPKWSQRGQIRDIIRPALFNWNKSSIDGLDELTKIMSDSFECIDMLVNVWIEKLILFDNLEQKNKVQFSQTTKLGSLDFKTIQITIDELKPNKIFWSRFISKVGIYPTSNFLTELI